MDLLLKGLTWQTANQQLEGDLRIRKGIIYEINHDLSPEKHESVIKFNNHFVYPGLINSHDHLEMNLYPRLPATQTDRVNPPYGNYTEWGRDIYNPKESPIKEIEKINIEDRVLWGGIKNLISGVTTVVHHNPWRRFLSSKGFPIKVLEKYAWSHSLSFGEKLLKNFPKKSDLPYIIHAAEGTDELASGEIRKLNRLGLLKHNTVLIHAVSLSEADIGIITNSGASIVWCPSSNFFLFKETTPIAKLKSKVKIALGTDSTLTGPATLLEEMRMAKKTAFVSSEEIYQQVTETPAKIFNLPIPQLAIGSLADLIVLSKQTDNYFNSLVQSVSSQIELVVINGQPRMCSEDIAHHLQLKKYFAKINGNRKWFYCDIARLKAKLSKKVGVVMDQNPVWKMID